MNGTPLQIFLEAWRTLRGRRFGKRRVEEKGDHVLRGDHVQSLFKVAVAPRIAV